MQTKKYDVPKYVSCEGDTYKFTRFYEPFFEFQGYDNIKDIDLLLKIHKDSFDTFQFENISYETTQIELILNN
jgi:hypothetical protein